MGLRKGAVFTEEHKKNISKALKGRRFSKEWKIKLSQSAKERIKRDGFLNKELLNSPQIKKRVAETLRGKYEDKKNFNWRGGKEKYLGKKAREAWEKYWIQKLSPDLVIHHIDGDRQNYDICNLVSMTNSNHIKLHWMKRKNLKKEESHRGGKT